MDDTLHHACSCLTSMKQSIKLVILFFICFFITHEIVLISDGLTDENIHSELAVIFGNTVNEDGSPSPRLKARLDKAIELFKNRKVKKLCVSGGLGKEGHYEGTKMAEYLLSNGIPSSNIFIDNQGKNTHATALNVREMFPEIESIVVVTQYHHVLRAKLAFEQIGIKNVSGAHANYWEMRDFYACTREFFAYYSYLITF